VGVSQAYLLKLVQSSQQHFFCKAQAFVTLDMRHHVLSMAVVTFRAVTRKWLSCQPGLPAEACPEWAAAACVGVRW